MSKPFQKTFVGSLVIIGCICAAIYFLFFASLGFITGHGEEATVPKLIGKSVSESVDILKKAGFEIDIDSSYAPEKTALIILNQQPDGGTTVKRGRTIFLIVNKLNPPTTPMPNLVNMSFRSAEMLLRSNKLILGDTIMKPDIAQGAVLSQLLSGKDIAAGTMIPQGTKISLVIGDGLGNTSINVPDLTGMSYSEGLALLGGSNLNYTVVFDGTISDTSTAVIYTQQPAALNDYNEPNKISIGDNVDIRVKQQMDDAQAPGTPPTQ
jgi:beta-lactam-binding protein with PASTA domain